MKHLTAEPATSSTLRLTRDTNKAAVIVENWHDETHTGAFWLCLEQPCHAVWNR